MTYIPLSGGASLPATATSNLYGGSGSAGTAAIVTIGPGLSVSNGTISAATAAVTGGSISGAALDNVSVGTLTLGQNYSGSGYPWANIGSRLVLARGGSSSATDYADVQLVRNAAYSTGSAANISAALVIGTTMGASNPANEWGILSSTQTSSTLTSGSAVGGYFQAVRKAGSAPIWGAIVDAVDQNDAASSASGVGVTSLELDLECNKADDAANPSTFGGVGVRKALDLVIVRKNASDTAQTVISNGIWFSSATSNTSGVDAHSNYVSAIGFALNQQVVSALDTRGAIAPSGASNPVQAVTMSAGHVVDFNGGSSLTSAPQRAVRYDSTNTRLAYAQGTNDVFTVTDFSGANYSSQRLNVGYNSGVNAVTISPAGSASNLQLAGFGGGVVSVPGTLQVGGGSVTWTSGAGAPASVQPSGSLYSRTDGATGSRLYVSAGGGTWAAVAGV